MWRRENEGMLQFHAGVFFLIATSLGRIIFTEKEGLTNSLILCLAQAREGDEIL